MSAAVKGLPWIARFVEEDDESWSVFAHDGKVILADYLTKPSALLIASAPELYNALEAATAKLRKALQHAGNADFAIDACCEQFDAALARARSEHPSEGGR